MDFGVFDDENARSSDNESGFNDSLDSTFGDHEILDSSLDDQVSIDSVLDDQGSLDASLDDQGSLDASLDDQGSLDASLDDQGSLDSSLDDHVILDSSLQSLASEAGSASTPDLARDLDGRAPSARSTFSSLPECVFTSHQPEPVVLAGRIDHLVPESLAEIEVLELVQSDGNGNRIVADGEQVSHFSKAIILFYR
jgi:hypothetical protein